MPAQYDAIKQSFLKKGESEKDAKTSASKIFISKGKGGSPHSRAMQLAADRKKPGHGKKRPVAFGKPMVDKSAFGGAKY